MDINGFSLTTKQNASKSNSRLWRQNCVHHVQQIGEVEAGQILFVSRSQRWQRSASVGNELWLAEVKVCTRQRRKNLILYRNKKQLIGNALSPQEPPFVVKTFLMWVLICQVLQLESSGEAITAIYSLISHLANIYLVCSLVMLSISLMTATLLPNDY